MIQTIYQLIIELLGPFGPIIVLGLIGLFIIMMTLPALLAHRVDPFDRIKGSNVTIAKTGDMRLRQTDNSSNLDRFAQYLEPQNQKEFSQRRVKLIQAGYRTKGAVRTYHFAQFALGILGLILGAIYYFFFEIGSPPLRTAMIIIGPGLAGYYIPSYWVERRRQTRQEEIINGFPDALDLMLVCVEAGQALDQSIQRVARETEKSYPTLSEEMMIVSNEIAAGKDRPEVLHDFAERANVSDIKAFVAVLVQSANFGTTIGDALRVYASEMRDKRVMRAEEKANTLPTKMTIATMAFTVPPLLVILVGPSVYDIVQFLG